MGNKLLLLLICIVIVSLPACNNNKINTNTQPTQSNLSSSSPVGDSETSEGKGEKAFLDGSLFPNGNDFIVNEFKIEKSNDSKLIYANLVYQFGKMPRDFLSTNDHKYYFVLGAPSGKVELFESKYSASVEGLKVLNDESAKYQVKIPMKLKDDITSDSLNNILKNQDGYQLIIYENPDAPAKVIVNVATGVGMGPQL
jgi:hypothetical protein